MHPVGIEQRRRGRAVGHRERRAGGPGAAGKFVLEPGVGALELLDGRVVAVLALDRIAGERAVDRELHRVHHMQIEEAVEEAHIEGRHRVGGDQAHRAGMRELQVFDDDAGLDHGAIAVDQHRELSQRPALQPFAHMPGRVLPQRAELERRAVLVERHQHLLGVGRKVVAVDRKRHRQGLPFSRSSSRKRPARANVPRE